MKKYKIYAITNEIKKNILEILENQPNKEVLFERLWEGKLDDENYLLDTDYCELPVVLCENCIGCAIDTRVYGLLASGDNYDKVKIISFCDDIVTDSEVSFESLDSVTSLDALNFIYEFLCEYLNIPLED